MIAKMSAVTLLYVLLTYLLWKKLKDVKITWGLRIGIGIIYGLCSIASTHFGIDYKDMILNVRDLGPMSAGLFFDPIAGIIAGLIGGIERYIAGTYFGVGSFTRVACSVSTCFAGFFAAFMNIVIFRRRKPSVPYALFMGAVIEVFHMYIVFITHRNDMEMAFHVVRLCAIPMIVFSAIGLALSARVIRSSIEQPGAVVRESSGEAGEDVPVAVRFQRWLFAVMALVLLINFGFNYEVQSSTAVQEASKDLSFAAEDIRQSYLLLTKEGIDPSQMKSRVGNAGIYLITDSEGNALAGSYALNKVPDELKEFIKKDTGEVYTETFRGKRWLSQVLLLDDGGRVLTMLPFSEVFRTRRMHSYETLFADILLFAAIYILIAMLVQLIVVDNLKLVNESLARITNGDLEEKVKVYNSTEFASLSDDINMTVDALKGYIEAAEKRFEQELTLARTIQDSALPKNFNFFRGDIDIFAVMDPAKEVGGDFYDFFILDNDKLALVIADVAGKGIPAALFMMRSKTAIRSLSETGHSLPEVLSQTNNELCQGNEAEMFVTVWMAIIDLRTGKARCINAGHEYPMLMRANGRFEVIKDKHTAPLGVMEDLQFEEYELELGKGDCLFVYTDGVPEAINEKEEQYGEGRLLEKLNACRNEEMKALLPLVRSDIEDFSGDAEQFDDITMMGFKFKGKGDA